MSNNNASKRFALCNIANAAFPYLQVVCNTSRNSQVKAQIKYSQTIAIY